jgi:hypothetical protein
MTLKDRCIEILTEMLNRTPTPQEIGNVMTDANIVNRAISELL